jgi:hypothetical protein
MSAESVIPYFERKDNPAAFSAVYAFPIALIMPTAVVLGMSDIYFLPFDGNTLASIAAAATAAIP